MEVILDFSTLRGNKPRILTPKRYGDHPSHFHMGVPPPLPQASTLVISLPPSVKLGYIHSH